MVRASRNVSTSGVLVTDRLLGEARDRAAAATDRVRVAERADPAQPGWDSEYEAATAAARATARRMEALERVRAAQLERSGQREATVKAAGGDLESIAASLAASRDALADAAKAHLRALAAVAVAVDSHNKLLAASRAQVAALGLQVRDDLVDVATGGEHPEGTLDSGGLRVGGPTGRRFWRPAWSPTHCWRCSVPSAARSPLCGTPGGRMRSSAGRMG